MIMLRRLESQLPSYPTPFIGRDEDIKAIARRLCDPDCRLLTLMGPGGIGKTRLAVEIAKHLSEPDSSFVVEGLSFANGIRFVDLQPVYSAEVLITAIANALGLLLSGSEDPRDQLLNYLSAREMLLVLDNFEQLLGCIHLLADILTIAPGVKLLVTSREALNMQEEWLWQVSGLPVPELQPVRDIESYSAVQLFAERARRTRQDFSLAGQERPVTRICQLADGMPLALELAAGWTKALSCAEIADEIQRGLDFLTTNIRNIPSRHQSMQAVFDSSWCLLTTAEQQVFQRLSVFRGGFRREAAEQVAGASLSTLAGLVDKSFLRVSADGRYHVQELLRQYGEEHLDADADAKAYALSRHCAYYADFLYRREDVLRGPKQSNVLDEIGDELDNISQSWEWAVAHDLIGEIHRSMHSLYLFCHIRSQTPEGERLFRLAIKRFEHEENATLTYLLLGLLSLNAFNGSHAERHQVFRAFRLAYTYWTEDKIATLLISHWYFHDQVTLPDGYTPQFQEQALQDFLEIFRAHNQPWGVNFLLYCLGDLWSYLGKRLEEAESNCRAALNSYLQMGDDWACAWATMGLAKIFESSQRYREAFQMWQQHQDFCAGIGDQGGVVVGLASKARVAAKLQDHATARLNIAQAIETHLERGSAFNHLATVFVALILSFTSEGKHERAAELSSFFRQQAEKVSASRGVEIAEHYLVPLAQRLPQAAYDEAVERGKTLRLRTLLEQLLDELSDNAPPPLHVSSVDSLTEREREVLALVAAGHSNRQIARDLFLTLNTVKSHIHHVYGKLGVESRTQAIARARDLHLI
jgi:predicted ATPase/DNA-binding CsgD family transcriptional regulator